jgi:hypothetical protein
VATFFQNLEEYLPDWHERYFSGKLNICEIQEKFLEVSSAYDRLDSWFDVQIKAIPAFGIDVYATSFPFETGYEIYPSSAQASLLLIRLENLAMCAQHAMYEFLGIENFILQNTNEGREKDYAELYHAFKGLPLPAEHVKKLYNTKFAQHFYSATELDIFTTKWTKDVKAHHHST